MKGEGKEGKYFESEVQLAMWRSHMSPVIGKLSKHNDSETQEMGKI